MSKKDLADSLNSTSMDLLDLSARNRLINTSRSSARSSRLDVVDELSSEVFRILVAEGKKMTFLPNPKASDSDDSSEDEQQQQTLPQPDDNDPADGMPAARHTDSKLQTKLASEKLQTRLLKLHRDAKTVQEEQGVNSLYLALGFLRWREAKSSAKDRFAPLILIPATLARRTAGSKFRIAWTEDDLSTNLSLQAKLKAEFDIILPELPQADDLNTAEYFAAVAKAVETKPDWEVVPNDMTLWFFSFSKFLMYRDLQADNWPAERRLEDNEMIDSLIGDAGFSAEPPICGDEANIDTVISVADMVHVMDADSSQSLAIEEAARGRSMVIQGPPGTGKSQTITNLIATFVARGKKVLFVAEKMAALDVVNRRLSSVGLGEACLELHSNKANKKLVLQDLERTFSLGKPKVGNVAEHAEELTEQRSRLNKFAHDLHTSQVVSGFTPYQLIGNLIRLRADQIQPGDFGALETSEWTLADFRGRLDLVRELVHASRELGTPAESRWLGISAANLLPMDIDRVRSLIGQISPRIDLLRSAGADLSSSLGISNPDTIRGIAQLARIGKTTLSAPAVDRTAIQDEVWENSEDAIRKAVRAGKDHCRVRKSISAVFVEAAWDADLSKSRSAIASLAASPFRFFSPRFRQAVAEITGYLKTSDQTLTAKKSLLASVFPKLPMPAEQCLAYLDSMAKSHVDNQTVDQLSDLAKRSFGTRWLGLESDWDSLTETCDWVAKCKELGSSQASRRALANVDNSQELIARIKQVATHLKPLRDELGQLVKLLQFDASVLGNKDILSVPAAALRTRLLDWQENLDELSSWSRYLACHLQAQQNGLVAVANSLFDGCLAENLPAQFEVGFYEAQLRKTYELLPNLARFSGESHQRTMERFRELDLERLGLARQEAALAHYERLPRHDNASGELGVLKHEMKKKRAHMPIRKLLSSAGHAVQHLKPVFMMSPLSVAQYLEPGVLEFDVLLIDEASQVRPVDALGAISRCKQIIVVGDERQMPPTNFFGKMLGGDDGEEDDNQNARDLESVLGLCISRNMPQRMLRWHYRSKHHSLIAVSNHEFYDNRLHVIPSPCLSSPTMGLVFHHVQDGWYDRGKSRTNRVEAKAVADAVIDHAKHSPEKSLGIGTFSVAQRDAILDELELLRRQHQEFESFFAEGKEERFFVKNLENIQGDERDVIFISVGYAQDKDGYKSMSFGPLQNDGGERRLNVLISRAKKRCEVFSTITADYIDTKRAKSRGVGALKTFLSYAMTGVLDVPKVSGGEFDSEFERQVARALQAEGFTIEPQVGVSGFRIDLAVVDPDEPGRFLLGIECDGAQYHSSRSARDRDRLRQAVLEDRGWSIHRIWSTDWFSAPEAELRKTLQAIALAKSRVDSMAIPESRPTSHNVIEDDGSVQAVQREEPSDSDSAPQIATVPYQEAEVDVPIGTSLVESPTEIVAAVVSSIVRLEGPIHVDEIVRRTASAWGLARAGSRIRESVAMAIDLCVSQETIYFQGTFCAPTADHTAVIRDRSEVDPSLRKPEHIPPSEIEAAANALVRVSHGIEIDELSSQLARLLGFKSTGKKLKAAVEQVVAQMRSEGVLVERQGRLYAGAPSS